MRKLVCYLLGHKSKTKVEKWNYFDGHVLNKTCLRCGHRELVQEFEISNLAGEE